MRSTIAQLVRSIQAYDRLEADQITALQWIDSGAPLCRIAKPDAPPQHLVSYFVLIDSDQQQVLLVDHRKAGLWLPSGGHVEPGEHPAMTVRRELREELALDAAFVWDDPLFLTVTRTVGATAGHTDVSLWYVLHGDSRQTPAFDVDEFHAVRWFAFDAVPYARAEPHMWRFMAKLVSRSQLLIDRG